MAYYYKRCVFFSSVTLLTCLAAFNVISMLPDHVFQTTTVNEGVKILACILLGAGVIAECFQCGYIPDDRNLITDIGHPDIHLTLILTKCLTFIALVSSFLTFFSTLAMKEPASLRILDVGYLALLISFQAFTLCVPLRIRRFVTYDYLARNSGGLINVVAFIRDHVLLLIYIGIWLHINFVEAKETLALYDTRKHIIPNLEDEFFGNHSGNGTHKEEFSEWLEWIQSSTYATTVEVVGLLLVCHYEQRHKLVHGSRRNSAVNLPTAQPEVGQLNAADRSPRNNAVNRPLLEPEVQRNAVDRSRINSAPDIPFNTADQVQHGCNIDYAMNGNRVISMVATLFVLGLFATGFACFQITHTNMQAAQSYNYLAFKAVVFFSLFAYMLFIYIRMAKRYPCSEWKDERKKNRATLDVKLLFGGTAGILFLIVLLIFASALGIKKNRVHFTLVYGQYFTDVVEVWLQYYVVSDCMALGKYLESKRRQHETEWRNLTFRTLPLIVANILLWGNAIWQWKVVRMIGMPDNVSPGPVWAVLEASLFPVAIFYRFHSAFLLCLVFCPNAAPACFRRVFG